MNQSRLDDIREGCARILIEHGNGRLDATFQGSPKENQAFLDGLRVHYLWGIIKESYLSGTDVMVGDIPISDNEYETVFDLIWHYSGEFADVDMSDYSDIIEDDGDGGATDPSDPTTGGDDYRSGSQTVTIGSNPVTFIKNGVPSSLASADYTVNAWLITETGYRQNNVVVGGLVASGFIATDILEGGTLYYQATLNT